MRGLECHLLKRSLRQELEEAGEEPSGPFFLLLISQD